jgi:hypothetical protein
MGSLGVEGQATIYPQPVAGVTNSLGGATNLDAEMKSFNAPITGGARITIFGQQLGSSTNSANARVTVESTLCLTTAWITYSKIECVVPPKTATQSSLANYVEYSYGTATAQIARETNAFSYDGPVITDVNQPNAPTSGAAYVTIAGLNFAPADETFTVSVGGSTCAGVAWNSETQFTCLTRGGSGQETSITMELETQIGTGLMMFSYDAPVLSGYSLNSNTQATAGTVVTVRGINFASVDMSLSASVGQEQYCITTSWTTTSSLTCKVPDAAGVNLPYVLLVDKQKGCGATVFSYDAPAVTYMNPSNGASSGASVLTVTGLNFASTDVTPMATVGATSCLTTTWTTSTVVTCAVGAGGDGKDLATMLVLNGAVGTLLGSYTFDAPVITGTGSGTSNAPVTAGTTVTIAGANFAGTDKSGTVKIGKTACTQSVWVSQTSLTCAIPPGSPVEGATASMEINDVAGTGLLVFTYDGPVITSADPKNGPTTGGASVSIGGMNFGASDATMTVAIAGSAWYPEALCSEVQWFSDSGIVCKDAGGAGASISVYVTAVGAQFQFVNVFSYNPPSITGKSHVNGPTTAGTSVTIIGTNFGSVDRTAETKVGATACATASWSTASSVVCLTPDGYGGAQQLSVNVRDQMGCDDSAFSYDPPLMSVVHNGNAPLTSGTTMSLLGTNFATSNTSPTIKLGSTVCATSSWTAQTMVKCHVAPYWPVISTSANQPEKDLDVSVTTGTTTSQLTSQAKGFTYDLPVITMITNVNAPASTGASVTVTGLNFNTYDNTVTVKVGSTACGTASWASSTSLTCKTPDGVGAPLNVAVLTATLDGGTGYLMFSYNAPVISMIGIFNTPTTAGGTVTMRGTNFGPSRYSVTAAIGDTACITTEWISGTYVQCQVASGAGKQRKAAITAGMLSVGAMDSGFTYDTPVVTLVAAANAAQSAGTSITVYGTNFAPSDETPSVTVGVTLCGTTSWSTVTSVVCGTTHNGWGTQKLVQVSLGTDGSLDMALTWDAPAISYNLMANGPTSGGTSVTVTGLNFGTHELSPTSMLGSTSCMTTGWSSATSVTCHTMAGVTASIKNVLMVAGVPGTATEFFSYDAPAVSRNHMVNAVTTHGTSVTIAGLNFGSSSYTPTVRLGMSSCGTTSWTSVTQLICHSASGSGRLMTTSLTVGSLAGTLALSFTYDAPSISHVASDNMPTTSGASITIQGHNFAPSDYTVTAYVGHTQCAKTSWLTNTAVLCKSNHGSGMSLPAVVEVSAVVGTRTGSFTYDAPIVTHSRMSNGPASANHYVTLHGHNFGAGDFTPTTHLMATMCGCSSWTTATTVTCFQVGLVSAPTSAQNRLGHLKHDFAVQLSSVVGTKLDIFTFDSPVINDLISPNAPLSSETSITVVGMNFVTVNLTPTIRIGATTCEQSVWIAQTSIRCKVAPGSGLAHNAIQTVSSVLGTGFLAFSYDSPVVTFVNPWNAPTTSGASMTISGTNFGSADLTPSISVGGSACATSIWSTTSAVLCHSPAGKGVAKALSMTITAQAGTGAAAFTYDAPVLTFVTLTNAPTLGSSTVSIMGTNFGEALALKDKPVVGAIGASNCVSMLWISTTSAHCTTAAGIGKVLTKALTIEGIVGSSTEVFTYDSAVITDMTSNSPTSGGTSVSIFGFNFGSEDASQVASVIDSRGEKVCQTTSWATTSAVVCLSKAGTGPALSEAVTVAEIVGCRTMGFTYDSPVLTHTSPNAPVSGGADITVLGTNFGVDSTVDIPRRMRIGSTECDSRLWQSDSSIICYTSEGYGMSATQMLTINALVGTTIAAFTFDSPIITHVTRPNAPTSTGATITIMGHNFVTTDTSATVRIGKTICLTSSWSSNSMMTCLSPAGTGADYKVSVTVNDLIGSQMQVFSYGAPVVTLVASQNAATSGGTMITISGKNFGYRDVSATASIGTTRCKSTKWVSTTTLTCLASSGMGQDVLISLNVDSQIGTKVEHFSYDAPVVSHTQGVSNGPTRSGTDITILGYNFAQFGDAQKAISENTLKVQLGGAIQAKSTVKWTSPTSLIARTPDGSGEAVEIAVFLKGNIGTLSAAFTYDMPVITDFIGTNSPASGGATITFQGMNFGMTDTSPTAMVGKQPCSTTAWQTDSSILCRASPGAGKDLVGNVVVSNVIGTHLKAFTFSAPVLTFTRPFNTPTTSGSVVTMAGFNFGSDTFVVNAKIGVTNCEQTTFYTDTSVLCTTAAGNGRDMSSGVSLEDVAGTGFNQFTYDSPVITFLVHPNSPTSGSAVTTINGMNFGSDKKVFSRIGETECKTAVWISATSMTCTLESGMQSTTTKDGGLAVATTIGSIVGTGARSFTYDAPYVTAAFSPNCPITGHATVTMTGNNFGDNTGTLRARIGSSQCFTTAWISNSAISCRVSPGNGYDHPAFIKAGRIDAETTKVLTYDTPVLTAFMAPNAPPSASSTISLLGFNFGNYVAEPVVAAVGGTSCTTSVWISQTHVNCAVPVGLDYAKEIQLTVTACPTGKLDCPTPQKVFGKSLKSFSYDSPVVTHYFPSNALPRDGKAIITISGTNFGQSKANKITASIGPTACLESTWLSESSVACTTPRSGESQVSQLDVAVTLGASVGALREIAYYQDANQFNPFDTCPCPDGVDADISYLTCGPDRDDLYVGAEIVQKGEALIMPTSGVSSGDDGILVSSTGDAEEYQKLFALPLYAFDSREASYSLTVTLKGDFTRLEQPGQPYTRMDVIMGLGNSKRFIGITKADKKDINMAYLVQGSYDSTSQVLAMDEAASANPMGDWGDAYTSETRPTPSTVTVRFTARKVAATQQIDLTVTTRQYYAEGGSYTGIRTIKNFKLAGKELGYEFVVFRQNRAQEFLVKDLTVSLCGCNEGGTLDECNTDVTGL